MKQRTTWNNRIKKAWICLLLLGLLCLLQGPNKACEAYDAAELSAGVIKLRADSLEVELWYGVQGQARYARECLLRGTVESRQPLFTGSLEFVLEEATGQRRYYEISIRTDEQGKGTFSLVLPMHRNFQSLKGRICSSNHTILTERDIPLKKLSLGTGSVIGVLSMEQEHSYAYLSSFGCHVVYLSPRDVAERKEGLSFFDLLLVEGLAVQSLNVRQWDAVDAWTRDGGTLILGTGADGISTLETLRSIGMLSGTWEGIREIQTCYGLEEEVQQRLNDSIAEYELELKGSPILYATETTAYCELSVEGARRAVTEEGRTLLHTKEHGRGIMEIFSISLDRKRKDYYGVYFVYIMQQYQSELGSYRLAHSDYPLTEEHLNSVILETQKNEVSLVLSPYLIVLFVYLLLVGPGISLLLKKRSKHLQLVLIPTLAITCLGLMYAMGSHTRVTKPYVKYVEFISQSGDESRTELTLLAAAPTAGEWELELNGTYRVQMLDSREKGTKTGDTRVVIRPEYRSEGLQAEQESGSIGLIFSGMSPFTEVEARLTYEASLRTVIEESVSLTENGLRGTITNVSDLTFSQAFLYWDGLIVPLGAIEPGKTVQLEDKQWEAMMEPELLLMGFADSVPEMEATEDMAFWSYLGNRIPGAASRRCFLGMTKDDSEGNPLYAPQTDSEGNPLYAPQTDSGKNTQRLQNREYTIAGGITVYCVELPEKPTETGTEEVLSILGDYGMRVLAGNYEPGDLYRYFVSDVVEAEYALPSEEISAICFHTGFNRSYDSYTAVGFQGTISVYNYETGTYDSLSEEFSDRELTKTEAYVSEAGSILIRYEKSRQYEGIYMQLPYVTYRWKKGAGADD